MSELDSIHHVALAVHDIESAISWYTSSSKCKVVFQSEKQAVLKFDNIELQLCLPSYLPSHIAFQRPDANTLGELREREEGVRATFISDASGNPVEIVE